MKKNKIVMVLLVLMISGFAFAEERPSYRNDSSMVNVEVVEEDLGRSASILNLNKVGYMIQGKMLSFVRHIIQMTHIKYM